MNHRRQKDFVAKTLKMLQNTKGKFEYAILAANFHQQLFIIIKEFISVNGHSIVQIWHGLVSFIILLGLAYGLSFDKHIDTEGKEVLRRGLEYLPWHFSLWSAALNTIYFTIYSIIDVINLYSKGKPHFSGLKEELHYAASYLLFSIIFPHALVVPILYWSLYYWKKDDWFPDYLYEVIPPFLNHLLHTLPIIGVLIYMCIDNKYEPPKIQALIGNGIFGGIYVSAVIMIKLRDEKWVYHFMDTISTLELNFVLAFCVIGSPSFFLLGYVVNNKTKCLRKKILEDSSSS